jgi:hypothetical protein
MMGQMAFGLVTAVEGETVWVEQNQPAFGAEPSAASGDGQSGAAARGFTIGEAQIVAAKTADPGALAVGKCVVVDGEADSSGQIAAEALSVSEPGETGCAAAGGRGFGGGGRGGGAGPAGGGEGSADAQGAAGGDPASGVPAGGAAEKRGALPASEGALT